MDRYCEFIAPRTKGKSIMRSHEHRHRSRRRRLDRAKRKDDHKDGINHNNGVKSDYPARSSRNP